MNFLRKRLFSLKLPFNVMATRKGELLRKMTRVTAQWKLYLVLDRGRRDRELAANQFNRKVRYLGG